MIWVATIFDHPASQLSHDVVILNFMKRGFYECDIMFLYFEIPINATETPEYIEKECVDYLISELVNSNCTAETRIRIDSAYGDGFLLFTEDPMALLEYMEANWKTKELASNNVVTVISATCSSDLFQSVELYLKASWYRLFISHHIVLLIDCKVNINMSVH